MSNRIVPLLLLIIIAMGAYILWREPATHGDMKRLKNEVATIPDKAIEGAAKISNRIEDAKIPEKTEHAMDKLKESAENLKEKAQDVKEDIRDDFKDAKRRDRAGQE